MDEKCGVAAIVQVFKYKAGMLMISYDFNIIDWQQLRSKPKVLETYIEFVLLVPIIARSRPQSYYQWHSSAISICVDEVYVTCRLIRISTFFFVSASGKRLRPYRHLVSRFSILFIGFDSTLPGTFIY